MRPRKEEARMIRSGGRSRKPLDEKAENDEEESSECSNTELRRNRARATTPPRLPSPIPSKPASQVASPSQTRPDGGGFAESPCTGHFRPLGSKDIYHDELADYPMSLELSTGPEAILQHASSRNIFSGETIPEDSYGNMQDIRTHPHVFPPDGQRILGPWGLSAMPDLYPMHYAGESDQRAAIGLADGGNLLDHYPFEHLHEQPYRNSSNAYHAEIHDPFAVGYDGEMSLAPRPNEDSRQLPENARFRSSSIIRQPSYDLPSHIRA